MELEPSTEFISRFKTKCLIGKVILGHAYPLQEQDVKELLLESWECKKDFSVKTVSHNKFIFHFEEHQDCMHVLMNVPWNVKGGLLVLSPWKPGQKPESFNFNYSPFWVQVHQLPREYMTPENGVKIGQVLGRFMYSEKNTPCRSPEDVPPAREFLRLRVVLDIREPLRTQYLVKRTGLSDIWIQFRYENLGVFCFKCGLIGYHHYACKHPRGIGTTKYNSLLSALPCSDAPLIGFSKMSTMLKESSDSEHEVSEKGKGSEEEIEESPDKMFDSESFSTRIPQMNTKLEESNDLGQKIFSELDKVTEKEKNSEDQMFDADENFSPRVFRKFKTKSINTMLTESSEPREEAQEKKIENEKENGNEKEKNKKEESSDKMFNANENLAARSGMQMLVINALVTMVMILNFAMMHRQVTEETASKHDHGKFENWKWLLENWKMTVVVAVYFTYLVWMFIRVAPKSWFAKVSKMLEERKFLPKMF